MANNLYVSIVEQHSGRSGVLLGVMQLLLRKVGKVAVFRPVITDERGGKMDPDIELLIQHFHLDIDYEKTYAYTLKEARQLINSNRQSEFMEHVFDKYKALEKEYDFVLCIGSDFLEADTSFEFQLNADLAANLDCPVMLVLNGHNKTVDNVIAAGKSAIELLHTKGGEIPCVLVARTGYSPEERKACAQGLQAIELPNPPLVYVMPDDPLLAKPTMADVKEALNATVIYGHNRLDTLVQDYVVASMQVSNFLSYIAQGQLVIASGDRSDVLLACLASRISNSYPDIAGILLTGGLKPNVNIQRLINGFVDGAPLPILAVENHTFRALTPLFEIHSRIAPGDMRKINTALGLFEQVVDAKALAARIINRVPTKITPKMFEYKLIEKAKNHKMRIVLPEGEDERILRAAEALLNRDVAHIILLGNEEKIRQKMKDAGVSLAKAEIIQPNKSPKYEAYVQAYFEARKSKGINIDEAKDKMLDTTYFGTMMVHRDDADGMVSGAINTTAHTIRPAFEFIKTKPGVAVVSSVFFMCMKDHVLVFGDCAVNTNPTAEQLAEIAISAAKTAVVFGVDPRVAMLSYSTGSSGKGADVDVVIEATRIAKERAPELLLEGPIQYDAAVDMDVAKTKMPNSQVAGRATVLIFPDLNTGNNTYKAVQRSSGAVAVGPVLQGLNKPVNDLSRGCTVPDIINTVAITAIQAQAEKGL